MTVTVAKGLLFIHVLLCMVSAKITIQGIVIDRRGDPVSGARITLERDTLATFSDDNGNFVLTNRVSIHSEQNQPLLRGNPIVVKNRDLILHLAQRTPVTVSTYTLSGKLAGTVKKTVDAGHNKIGLSFCGPGLYFHKVTAGNSHYLFGTVSTGSGVMSVVAKNKLSRAAVSSRTGFLTNTLDDFISVTKEGYLDYRIGVSNPDTSGLEIILIECAGILTDIDGNEYETVRYGNQVWMVQNLRTTRYRSGAPIVFMPDSIEWMDNSGFEVPAFCYYDNSEDRDSIRKYGALYNWWVVDPANPEQIAPEGWRAPSHADWDTLVDYLVANGYNWDGTREGNKIGQAVASRSGWHYNAGGGRVGNNMRRNNSAGFSAYPVGLRVELGFYDYRGIRTWWWSNVEGGVVHGRCRSLAYPFPFGFGATGARKHMGLSVRLVRDAD